MVLMEGDGQREVLTEFISNYLLGNVMRDEKRCFFLGYRILLKATRVGEDRPKNGSDFD